MNSFIMREYFAYATTAFVIIFFLGVVAYTIKGIYAPIKIIKTGKDALATISSIQQKPGGKNGYVNVDIMVSFKTSEETLVNTKFETKLLTSEVSEKYKVGTKIKLKYDKKDPSKVVLGNFNR